eukprot:12217968-Alexandrium_andersonii.AAC.1
MRFSWPRSSWRCRPADKHQISAGSAVSEVRNSRTRRLSGENAKPSAPPQKALPTATLSTLAPVSESLSSRTPG